ncbi:MAG TPA: phage virion morphogenesis protein [Methylococcus sp.]|nr:phage virion morphogenesis protein [Methylococcus sp.]
MITIEIDDREIQTALNQLADQVENLRPVLADIGEYLIQSTKSRFATGTAPDGSPWARNSEVTIGRYLDRYRGSRKKDGSLSKRGQARAAAKKPLIGETKRLSGEIAPRVGPDTVEVGSALEYAAVQQFGARRGAFGRTRRGAPIPWGDIPPRPFLGISDGDREEILAIIAERLERAMK